MKKTIVNDEIIPAVSKEIPVPTEIIPVVSEEIPIPTEIIPVVSKEIPVPTEETAAWKEERDKRVNSCDLASKKLFICSFTSSKAKKAVVVAKADNEEAVVSSIVDMRQYKAGQAACAVWAFGQSINWLYGQMRAEKYSLDKDTLLVLGTNNNAAAIYIQKALFSGQVNFSKSCSLSQGDRQYIAESALKIAGIIANMKEKFGCDIAVEALDRNVITSNGHAALDLYALSETTAAFGEVSIKNVKYQMATVPVTLEDGTKRSFNFFTRFRPTFQGAKGVVRSYKAKDGKTPVEFYIESPYRATMWKLYNGVREKINH